MLPEFVGEEIKEGIHNQIIIEFISYLIGVKNDGRNSINDSEMKNILNKNHQNVTRLQSKKLECILNLLKKEYLLQ